MLKSLKKCDDVTLQYFVYTAQNNSSFTHRQYLHLLGKSKHIIESSFYLTKPLVS